MTILTKNSTILSIKSAVLKRAGDTNTVTIGGRAYPTVKIGNQIWMAENLDWKFEVNGIQIPIGGGSVTTPAAWYLDNDEHTYGWNG